jgi:hypothetical protein
MNNTFIDKLAYFKYFAKVFILILNLYKVYEMPIFGVNLSIFKYM